MEKYIENSTKSGLQVENEGKWRNGKGSLAFQGNFY